MLSVNSEVRDLSARASRGPAGPARGSDGACGPGVRVRGDIVRSCPSCGLAASLYRAYTPEGPLVDAVVQGNLQVPAYARASGHEEPHGLEVTARGCNLETISARTFLYHSIE